MTERLTRAQAFDQAHELRLKAENLRQVADMKRATASRFERWARRWYDWADDEYGDVPYPGDRP